MRPFVLAACLSLLPAVPAVAQCPPGSFLPVDFAAGTTVPDRSVAWSRWQAGQQALAAGDLAPAREHLLATLTFHPAAVPVWLDLLLACGDDGDLQQLYADGFAAAAIDAGGRLNLDAAQRRLLATRDGLPAVVEQARKLAAARAAAIAELARSIDRNKPQGGKNAARAVLVHWAVRVLATIGVGTPRAVAAVAPAVNKVAAAFAVDFEAVTQGLQRVLQQRAPLRTGEPETRLAERALRAARILVGLARQGTYPKLPGPPAREFGALAEAAEQRIAQRAAELAAARVWTVAELEQLTPAESAAFTDAHADWHSPAVAQSPAGRYRIETCCGHGTLLEVARTIELHHARLAAHCGKDPFADRQGTVRIVPEHDDLEIEGSPYWWAGGFQSGDLTVVRFAWSNGPELGRALVHELTHRFDGVLRPFLGGWHGEGHAQWTAAGYARTTDTAFADDLLDVHAAAMTCWKGYGNRESFTKLLDGTIEEYRDNYVAGYSLYAFLRSHPLGKAKYRDALDRFERGSRAAHKDAIGWFTKCFCDGAQGRPATLEAFLTEWNGFVTACYEWNDDRKTGHEWVGEYRAPERAEVGPLVLDPPTWSWARTRAEPWFGQDHAAAATRLLHEVGDAPATVAAGVWSLTVDGWRPDTSAALLDALRTTGPPEAADAFAAVAAGCVGTATVPGTRLPDQVRAVRVLLTALAERSTALRESAPGAAAASAAEHDRVAALLGVAPLPPLPNPAATPAHHLATAGLTESSLLGYDDGRVPGLWYATPDGDLHVGREQPRDATGTLDREAHRRDAFVHGVEWLAPGAYVVRGRVHFTTAYVAGAIVFGRTRSDRDLRLAFTSGDQQYAIGKRERAVASGVLALQLLGSWERDGQLPDSAPFRSLELPANQTWFDFRLHVRGPRVDVAIDGETVMRYTVHDGSAIQGQVGFAMSQGAVRVQAPMVQRRDAVEPLVGLDLTQPGSRPLDDLIGLPVRGLLPGPDGTLVLWLPPPVADAQQPAQRLPRLVERFADLLQMPHLYPQTWQVAVPVATPAEERTAVVQALQELRPGPLPVLEHAVAAPFDGSFPWLLFVDGTGVLRAAALATDPAIRHTLLRWARMLRAR